MSHPPLISAVIIFLNAETFLREAIESVLAQTFQGWKLLLVDDGSTNGSSEIAKRYAKTKVHHLTHPGHRNCGKGASSNLGFDMRKTTI